MFKTIKLQKALIGAVAVGAMALPLAAFATDWYVDANNGNDAWDGTTAAIPSQATIEAGGTIPGPRKTLHAIMSDERVQPGDIVKAAEGVYKAGGAAYGTEVTTNRVLVKAGVTLLATGARDATFIRGADGAASDYSAGAVRCVYFLPPPEGAEYGYGIVKGFTLYRGRTANTSEHGGASSGNGLLVECDFQSNGCGDKNRGGTMLGGTALRCRFSSRSSGYVGYNGTKAIDSLVAGVCTFYFKCKLYNCTFSGNGYARYCYTYNCFFIGTGTSVDQSPNGTSLSTHKNTFSRSEFHETSCTHDATCRVVTEAESPYDDPSFRPMSGSVLIDAGNMSDYAAATNGWPAAWLAECGKDYYGKDRVVNGTIDVGCGETQNGSDLTISDSSDGLVVSGAEKGETHLANGTSVDLTFSRTLTSDRLCLGVDVDGVFHSFGGTTGDVPYAVTIPATIGHDFTISAVYETDQKDWYVSPTGDDSNKGYHRNCPRKTLVKAMELATGNGHVVHAAAGVYDEGEAWYDNCSNRVVVSGVGLVADEWPLRETVIKGASDTTTADADADGNGSAAVRCAYVKSGGYVRGFKLTDGRTVKGTDAGAHGGGAYVNNGALVDCELADNGCAYRGSAVATEDYGVLLRCYVHDSVSGSYMVYGGGKVVDSYVAGTCYQCKLILNSTVPAQVRANGLTRIFNTYLRDAYRISADAAIVACTNCVFTRPVETAISAAPVAYDPENCIFEAATADNLDKANGRPKNPASVLVDAGSKALYDKWFPSAWDQFKGTDFSGGQRIYNVEIDVGCGEYDFRPDFAGLLGPKAVVSAMGPNVTTNAVSGIVVPEGEAISLAMQPRGGRVTMYELAYTPEGGERTVVSEVTVDGFSRTLEGPCTVQSLSCHVGSVFTIR